METKTTAVVVGTKDRGDFDKYLVLVTAEGKKNCIIKGIRRASSKLRFAGELFSLCEYVFSEGRGTPVVTNAYNLSMNYELRLDYDRFYAAGVAASLAEQFCAEEDPEFLPFFLKSLEYIKADEKLGLIKYLIELFERSGYALDFETCVACGSPIGVRAGYSPAHSGVVCETCGGQRIREGVLELLRRAASGDFYTSETGKKTPLVCSENPDSPELAETSYFSGAVRLLTYHLNECEGNARILEEFLQYLRKNGG